MTSRFVFVLLLSHLFFSATSQTLHHTEEHDHEFLYSVSELYAEWVDPDSADFSPSHIGSPNANYSRNSVRDTVHCPCTSVFAPNIYTGPALSQSLKDALEYAQCLWSCVIDLPGESVQLEVVHRSDSERGVLASCGPMITNKGGVLKPCPLSDSSRCETDMRMYVDPNSVDYYFGLDGKPGKRQYDFVSIALHELGHGFGFVGFAIPSGTGYREGHGSSPFEFDKRIRYKSSTFPWSQSPPSSSSTAIKAITSGKLYFEGDRYPDIKLHAPKDYSPGSSVYHLDEAEYPTGDPNSLMTPKLRNGESIHSIGFLTCDILSSIGYSIPSWEACGYEKIPA